METDNMIRILDRTALDAFKQHLELQEKSIHTMTKYLRDVAGFIGFLPDGRSVTKALVIRYKEALRAKYAIRSVNSMLASLNAFFAFLGWHDCRVRTLRLQREVYCPAQRELSREEYGRLVRTAQRRGDERLSLILQTICGTGIRISELAYITVEAVRQGEAEVRCKNKTRTVFLVRALQQKLLAYIKKQGIQGGSVFVNAQGRPMSRTTVWREMKSLCRQAQVDPRKVFPHNLRHLFARVFYNMEKDIAKRADILGHSSIDTPRLYIISTGVDHRQRMEKMRLVL